MLLTSAPVTLKEAIALLGAHDDRAALSLEIEVILRNPTFERMDALIRTLQDQNRDNSRAVRSVLGPYVYEKLGFQA